jgi:hypothetical protein
MTMSRNEDWLLFKLLHPRLGAKTKTRRTWGTQDLCNNGVTGS